MRQEVINHLDKVGRMRTAQKKYFKSREKADMIASKQLEMQVDIDNEKLLQALRK